MACPPCPPRQGGFTLVELMIGIALALFLSAGATKFFVDHLRSSRQLVAEMRLNQDLRATMDVVTRELRRAGYWSSALQGATSPAVANPFAAVSVSPDARSTEIAYRHGASAFDGLHLNDEVVRGHIGTWQGLTDPDAVRVTTFSVTPKPQEISLGGYCMPACTSTTPGCPSLVVRHFLVRIEARSTADRGMVRRMEQSVRVRNDEIVNPSCP